MSIKMALEDFKRERNPQTRVSPLKSFELYSAAILGAAAIFFSPTIYSNIVSGLENQMTKPVIQQTVRKLNLEFLNNLSQSFNSTLEDITGIHELETPTLKLEETQAITPIRIDPVDLEFLLRKSMRSPKNIFDQVKNNQTLVFLVNGITEPFIPTYNHIKEDFELEINKTHIYYSSEKSEDIVIAKVNEWFEGWYNSNTTLIQSIQQRLTIGSFYRDTIERLSDEFLIDFDYLISVMGWESITHTKKGIAKNITKAKSGTGPEGGWQINIGMGRKGGLPMDKWVDGRYHIYDAGKIACKILNEPIRLGYTSPEILSSTYVNGWGKTYQLIKKYGEENLIDHMSSQSLEHYTNVMAIHKLLKLGLEYPKTNMTFTDMEELAKVEYIIQNGDSLFTISKEFGTTIQVLSTLNPHLKDTKLIQPGRTLKIAPGLKLEETQNYI